MNKSFLLVFLMVAVSFTGCIDSEDSNDLLTEPVGEVNVPGNALVLTRDADATECSNGGITLDVGVDEDGDGKLNSTETFNTSTICNGADGIDGKDGSSCSAFDSGNGTYTVSCEDGTSFTVSDGQQGPVGEKGEAGEDVTRSNSTLLTRIDDPDASLNCVAGGRVISYGLDNGDGGGISANGNLEFGEIDTSTTLCSTMSFGLFRDLNLGSQSSNPSFFIALDDERVIFSANDGESGRELWLLRPDAGSVVMVKDINLGTDGSDPMEFIEMNGELYFRADDGEHGGELWKTNGTEEGTIIVLDLNPGSDTSTYFDRAVVLTNTYGVAPSNTTLTIRYYTGGGTSANVLANTLTNPNTNTIQFLNGGLDSTLASTVFSSIATNNPIAASGGSDGDTIEEIRQNILSNYGSQLRNVTADDYLVRALSMPSKFGTVSKAFTQKPDATSANTTLDIFVLSQDINGNLATASKALKQNIKTYLNEYRMIGDTISIKDAFIINFGIDFEIITLPNYNNNKVLEKCILELQRYFSINKWQINQPIIINPLFVLLDEVEGVQTVKKVQFKNLVGISKGYSQIAYDLEGATQNGTIFPSLDPSIFEIKYPNTDIKGQVVAI